MLLPRLAPVCVPKTLFERPLNTLSGIGPFFSRSNLLVFLLARNESTFHQDTKINEETLLI
jgi:hypothetical protein